MFQHPTQTAENTDRSIILIRSSFGNSTLDCATLNSVIITNQSIKCQRNRYIERYHLQLNSFCSKVFLCKGEMCTLTKKQFDAIVVVVVAHPPNLYLNIKLRSFNEREFEMRNGHQFPKKIKLKKKRETHKKSNKRRS